MREFQERSRLRRIFFSRPFFVLLIIITFFLGLSVNKVYRKSRDAVLRNRAIETELEELRKRKNELEAGLKKLETPEGVEKELREKFQVKKPGEEMIIIVDEELAPVDNNINKKEGVFTKIWGFFKSIF